MRRGFFVLNSSPTSSEAALYAAQNTPNSCSMRRDRKKPLEWSISNYDSLTKVHHVQPRLIDV